MKDYCSSIQSEFNLFEETFTAALQTDHPLLHNVLDYVHAKRGKQLRPILVLLSAALCRGITSKTISTAVALEIMHTASLIHDDVVDNSPIRRGTKSVHEVWSNKVAILVGDYMLARVMHMLAEIRNSTILNIVSEMSAALTSGELLQLHSDQSMWISEEQYMKVIRQKTAHLFSACSEAGAASAGATTRQQTAMRQFGMYLGLCFQLKDDVYDEANNAFGVELETVVLPGLAINAQVLVDQIATKAGGDNPVVPNAYGFLANVSYLKRFAPFDAEFYVEGYYSYPSLYLNKKLNPDGTKNWNYDWIVGYRRDGYYGDIDYSGHRYGPDTKMLLAGLELSFTEIGLKTRHEFEYKITGEMDKFDSEYEFKVMTPTGIPETRLSYRSFNEYMPMDNLKLNLDYELGLWINYAHKEGHNRFIPQIIK